MRWWREKKEPSFSHSFTLHSHIDSVDGCLSGFSSSLLSESCLLHSGPSLYPLFPLLSLSRSSSIPSSVSGEVASCRILCPLLGAFIFCSPSRLLSPVVEPVFRAPSAPLSSPPHSLCPSKHSSSHPKSQKTGRTGVQGIKNLSVFVL